MRRCVIDRFLILFRFQEGKSLENFDDNKDACDEEPDEIKVRSDKIPRF